MLIFKDFDKNKQNKGSLKDRDDLLKQFGNKNMSPRKTDPAPNLLCFNN